MLYQKKKVSLEKKGCKHLARIVCWKMPKNIFYTKIQIHFAAFVCKIGKKNEKLVTRYWITISETPLIFPLWTLWKAPALDDFP